MAVRRWKKVGEAVPIGPRHYGKQIVHQDFEDPFGKVHDFYLYTLQDSVVVLPVTVDLNVLAVREYKQGADRIQIGLVGGYCNDGESLNEAARREVREETGHRAGQLIDLGHVDIIPRHSSGRVQLYLALECVLEGEPTPDSEEVEIEVVSIPLEDWLGRVLGGETTETFSVAATTRSLPHLGYKLSR